VNPNWGIASLNSINMIIMTINFGFCKDGGRKDQKVQFPLELNSTLQLQKLHPKDFIFVNPQMRLELEQLHQQS